MASLMRIGTLEAGHGCLPFWIARLDEHAETIKAPISVKRSRRPTASFAVVVTSPVQDGGLANAVPPLTNAVLPLTVTVRALDEY